MCENAELMCPSKIVPFHGDPRPYPVRFVSPPSPYFKRYLDPFRRFAGLTNVTDRQTDHATSAMRPNTNICKAYLNFTDTVCYFWISQDTSFFTVGYFNDVIAIITRRYSMASTRPPRPKLPFPYRGILCPI